MSTDFTTNSVKISGGMLFGTADTPSDMRTRVETESDIMSIPMPYIGMVVYAKDTGKRYEILTLKDKKQGLKVVKNAIVDTYRELTMDASSLATKVDNLEKELDKLLNPYAPPVVSLSMERTPTNSILEKGTTVNISGLKTSITKKSENITKIAFFQDDTELNSLTENIANGGTYTCSFDNALQIDSDISNNYFKIEVTDASNNVVTANTGGIIFVYPYYFGAIDRDADINNDAFANFTKVIAAKGNNAHSYTSDNQCMIFAYPKNYGSLSTIIDNNGFNLTDSFNIQEVDIECLDGTTQTYYVYKNEPSTVSNFNITFKY